MALSIYNIRLLRRIYHILRQQDISYWAVLPPNISHIIYSKTMNGFRITQQPFRLLKYAPANIAGEFQ